MRKFIALGALALLALSFVPTQVHAGWRSLDVVMRTARAAYAAPGYRDSTKITLGVAAEIDTSASMTLEGMRQDSLAMVVVEAFGDNAFASGESLYVGFETGNGNHFSSWTLLASVTCGTCRAGGFGGAGTILPAVTTGGVKRFNGAMTATSGMVASASGALGLNNIYAGFAGAAVIRLKILSTITVVTVANPTRFRIWYTTRDD